MQFLAVLKAFMQLLPIIHEMIDKYEILFPGNGQGSKRLAAVKAAVQGAIVVGDNGSTLFNALWPIIEKEIAEAVSFKKAAK